MNLKISAGSSLSAPNIFECLDKDLSYPQLHLTQLSRTINIHCLKIFDGAISYSSCNQHWVKPSVTRAMVGVRPP